VLPLRRQNCIICGPEHIVFIVMAHTFVCGEVWGPSLEKIRRELQMLDRSPGAGTLGPLGLGEDANLSNISWWYTESEQVPPSAPWREQGCDKDRVIDIAGLPPPGGADNARCRHGTLQEVICE
jgi:hypothetical protein